MHMSKLSSTEMATNPVVEYSTKIHLHHWLSRYLHSRENRIASDREQRLQCDKEFPEPSFLHQTSWFAG